MNIKDIFDKSKITNFVMMVLNETGYELTFE